MPSHPAPEAPRVPVDAPGHPHFIGCWSAPADAWCGGLIDIFEANRARQTIGKVGTGDLNPDWKDSTDLRIDPIDLETPGFEPLNPYFAHLQACYRDYCAQWAFLRRFAERVQVGAFNIQRYDDGGHYARVHSERTAVAHLHRLLAWMTYLNDVPGGGETEFPHFDLRITPEAGKTLIWPAEWTHAHRGCPVRGGPKYIITGWIHVAV